MLVPPYFPQQYVSTLRLQTGSRWKLRLFK
jgi:hypothetical protein